MQQELQRSYFRVYQQGSHKIKSLLLDVVVHLFVLMAPL